MSQKQLQQSKRQQNQQNRQTQRSSENDSGQYIGGIRPEVKSSAAEMLAAAEALFNGAVSERSVEAASFFGNQVMLNMSEQNAAHKNSVKCVGDVLGGEMDCVFADNSPLNETAVEAAFPPESVPSFSPEVPTADITQVGHLAAQYLL